MLRIEESSVMYKFLSTILVTTAFFVSATADARAEKKVGERSLIFAECAAMAGALVKSQNIMFKNDKVVEWVVVRPDGLIDENEVSKYTAHPSPTRSAIFNDGKVSRVNVAAFMNKLITDQNLWEKWKGQMPVIYNKEI